MSISKFLLSCFICCAFSFSSIGQQSQSSMVQMSPAEYQNLIEIILKAKRSRLIAYRATHSKIKVSSNTSNNDFNALKQVEELELALKSIEESNMQQAKDAATQREMIEIKNELERQIISLKKEQESSTKIETKRSYDYDRTNKAIDTQRLEKHINRLEKELADQRKNSANKKDIKKITEDIKQLSTTYSESTHFEDTKNNKRIDQLEKELQTLTEQFKLLLFVSKDNSSAAPDTKDMAAVLELSKKISSLENELALVKNTTNLDSQYIQLETKVEKLEKALQAANQHAHKDSEVAALNAKIISLEAQLKDHKHTRVSAPVSAPIIREDVKTFITKHRQQNVYFPNGSPILTRLEKDKIEQVANWLDTYQELDIIVKGFASNTGSQIVNQQLSKSRAETVKQYLLSIGVKANRISLEPLGVDTSVSDHASARRAEIHLYFKQ